ncbi:MAG: hypothetical protein HQL03_05320 [Nitrospirae bacterium]|nr:hypothetical protein [Nitrospirota bacterium]
MIRVHLAQIFYNPSYYNYSISYLEEPCFFEEASALTDIHMGKLRSVDKIESFLIASKKTYIEYIRKKLRDIAIWSGKRGAHILVFPEYSVPQQILPDLQGIARKFSMIIISGTHRVPSDNETRAIYKTLNIDNLADFIGHAVSPIFLPDGSVLIAEKLRKSKWEPNLILSEKKPDIIDTICRGVPIRLAVIPCIDALHIDIIGKLFENKDSEPHIIICPSLSPSTKPFENIASVAISHETLFTYVNTASSGNTSFFLPKSWEQYLEGPQHKNKQIPKDIEAILELEIDLEKLFIKKGSINTSPIAKHPFLFPIVYTLGVQWLSDYLKCKEDIIEWLNINDTNSAKEWLDIYLTDNAQILPDIICQNLKYMSRSVLPFYNNDIDNVMMFFNLVLITDIEETKILWSKRVNNALNVLHEYYRVATTDYADISNCINYFKTLQSNLPNQLAVETEKITETSLKQKSSSFMGEENLIAAFQDRGTEMKEIGEIFSNKEKRVIIITGAIGIGKSDFVNCFFRKKFSDWDIFRIKIPSEGQVARVITEIGHKLKLSLDIDSLASLSPKPFRQKIREVFSLFYSKSKRALILDDVHEILKIRDAKESKNLTILIEEAATCDNYIGGRTFIISSQWLPDKCLHLKGVYHYTLKGIKETYIERIIDYQMRQANLVSGEAPLQVPQALLDVINGHPLSARLVVKVLNDNRDLNTLSHELTLRKVTGFIVQELLRNYDLSPIEQFVMMKLSVFRLPIHIGILKNINQFEIDDDLLKTLKLKCVLSYDGSAYEIHEAVRRFFYKRLVDAKKNVKEFHTLASLYYTQIYESPQYSVIKDPSIIAELVHHLSLSGEISRTKDLRLLLIQEIRPAARKKYKELRDYDGALSLYRLLAEIVPDDVVVLAYIGRCDARLNRWDDADQGFQRAIEMAKRKGSPSWWIYRDWGHIKARYSYYSEAKEFLSKASETMPNHPSINSSLAFIYWQDGDIEKARELFESAINSNRYHEYTLSHYSKFLDSVEEHTYADMLRDRLNEIQSGDRYVEPIEYDSDLDDL